MWGEVQEAMKLWPASSGLLRSGQRGRRACLLKKRKTWRPRKNGEGLLWLPIPIPNKKQKRSSRIPTHPEASFSPLVLLQLSPFPLRPKKIKGKYRGSSVCDVAKNPGEPCSNTAARSWRKSRRTLLHTEKRKTWHSKKKKGGGSKAEKSNRKKEDEETVEEEEDRGQYEDTE